MTALAWNHRPIQVSASSSFDRTKFTYDAVTSEGKRRPATGLVRSEDAELLPTERRRMLSQARDLQRNFPVAAWMLRRHLDYVCSFTFQAKTKDRTYNRLVEFRMKQWGRKEKCDISRRHSLRSMIRLAEARACVDGDLGLIKLRDGRIQAIEGDRIRTPMEGSLPPGLDPSRIDHGVVLDEFNAATSYLVCKRGPASDFTPQSTRMIFQRAVPARDMYLHGYFDRFDQVRGISPLAPGINGLIDIGEGIDYALAKLKVEQLLGLALYRESPNNDWNGEATDYKKITLGKRPFLLNLDPGDRAEFLSSTNPSNQFQSFMQLMIQLVMKCLDIPYSFFAENYTNYSGARQALLQYEQSCDVKRDNLLDTLNALTEWRLGLFVDDNELPPPPDGFIPFEWVPAGLPWIDPVKEVQGDLAALGGALTSRTRILKRRGIQFEDIVDELKSENKLLTDNGLPTDTSADHALVQALVTADEEPQPQ